MKQTAVEYLIEQLENHSGVTKAGFKNVIDKAKEMEIEQLKNVWESSDTNMRNQFSSSAYKAITFNEWFEKFNNK